MRWPSSLFPRLFFERSVPHSRLSSHPPGKKTTTHPFKASYLVASAGALVVVKPRQKGGDRKIAHHCLSRPKIKSPIKASSVRVIHVMASHCTEAPRVGTTPPDARSMVIGGFKLRRVAHRQKGKLRACFNALLGPSPLRPAGTVLPTLGSACTSFSKCLRRPLTASTSHAHRPHDCFV